MYRLILFFLIISTSFGCTSQIEWDLPTITITQNANVVRGEPNYTIYPINFPHFIPSAYMVPFKADINISVDKSFFEREMTKILYNNWAKNQVFERIVLESKVIHNLQKAVQMARTRNCDLVIVPRITYCLLGGESSPTRMAIKIDIYETKKGNLIWSITHMGEIVQRDEKDYILFKKRSKYPHYAEAYLLDILCTDIFPPIKKWAHKKGAY